MHKPYYAFSYDVSCVSCGASLLSYVFYYVCAFCCACAFYCAFL